MNTTHQGQADRDECRRRKTERHHTSNLAGFLPGDRERLIQLAQHEARMMIEGQPVVGRRYAACRSMKQWFADLIFQLGELLAQSRLRYEEAS